MLPIYYARYELPTLVCARYRWRAVREREAVCHCSGGQMAWSPDPYRIIKRINIINNNCIMDVKYSSSNGNKGGNNEPIAPPV